MKYKLLVDRDIKHKIKDDFMNKLLMADEDLIAQAESIAVSQLLSKLSKRFDASTLTPAVNTWADNTNYFKDAYVYYTWLENNVINEGFYIALINNTGLSPNNNLGIWKEKDPRELSIVSYVVDITLYHLHCMLYPCKKNEVLKDYYAEAMAKIDLLIDLDGNPNLVIKTTAPDIIGSAEFDDDDYVC